MEFRNILVLGAGRSSAQLISYLLRQAKQFQWQVTVGDLVLEAAQRQVINSIGKAVLFNISNIEESTLTIREAHVVVSLLPAHLHIEVAKICLKEGKHLITASYVTEMMQTLDAAARQKQLLFLNECGLDPGIDHMSAMQVIDGIHERGGVLTSFESFTGGLIAPETDPGNPWRYKFTWNPRNVVMAGQGTAKYLQDGGYKYIPYQQLFMRTIPIQVPGLGAFEGYANRDSLKYQHTYGLNGIKTLLRGTLRYAGYCQAWNVLVQLGCCDDTYELESVSSLTHRKFIELFLNGKSNESVEDKLCKTFGVTKQSEAFTRLQWSGFYTDEPIGLTSGTPAQVTEHILNKKWRMLPGDKDFIVMWHRFKFSIQGKEKEIQAWLSATGVDEINTAMAKTVGLPLGIAARLVMQGKIKRTGVTIPVFKELYQPVLKELATEGIALQEQES